MLRSFPRMALGAVLLSMLVCAPRAEAQGRPFEDRFAETLGATAAGAGIGAAAGATVGLLLPALFCSAGVGEDGCAAAWVAGLVGLGTIGWVLGGALGAALANDEGEPFAAAGLGLLAAAVVAAVGVPIYGETGDDAALYVTGGLWLVTQCIVTALAATGLAGDDDGAAASAGAIRF